MKRLLLIPILFLAGLASAQIVDQFTYTGALNANGWSVHNGTAGQTVTLTSPSDNGSSLSYPGFAVPSGNRIALSQSNSEDLNHAISGITGTGYMSFLMKVQNLNNLIAAGDYFVGFGGPAANPLAARTFIKPGVAPNTFQLGIQNTTTGTITQTYVPTEYPVGTTVLVVIKYNNTTTPHTASLFVNPVIGGVEPVAGAINTSGTATSFNNFATIYLRQGTNTGNYEIDEIRAGSTWASVTPTGVTPCANTTATIDTVSCATSYEVPSGDETYNVGGTYYDTIPNAANCDSILTINLSFVASINYYPDTDGDGLGDNTAPAVPACTPPTDHVTNNNDCDDTNPAIGAAVLYYVDADTDGYGSASATGVPSCTLIPGSVTNNTDCNDNNNAIHPGATEIPNNGIDEDCNGSDLVVVIPPFGMYEFEGNSCTTPVLGVTTQPANAIFGLFEAQGALTCTSAGGVINYNGFNTVGTIDLTQYYRFNITPAACYGLDLNMIKFNHRLSSTGGTPTLHVRSSLDNYAADLFTKQLVVNGSNYLLDTVQLGAAFDNMTSMVEFRFYITNMGQTGTTYRYDNVTVYGTTNALPTQTYYADTDGDGFGNPAAPQSACTAPPGHVLDNTDCDDTDEEEFPGAVWYADTDGDGLGDAGSSQVSCTRPTDHVSNDDDCNDTDDQIGIIITYYVDGDGDTFGDADATGVPSCTPIVGSVTNNTDCDDSDEDINPNATEVCDGVDNNCDGSTDEGLTLVTYYQDTDNDTYGNPAVSLQDCTQPTGYVTNDDDCNDANPAAYPGATEINGNGVDENCDGVDGYLGIEESILANLNVYPNPGTSSVVLNMSNGWNGFKVTFVSVDGKEIALTSTQTSATDLEFNTNSLVSGIYIIRLTSSEGTATVRWTKN